MKRFVIGFLMALCLVLIAVPARAAQGSASWYIDEDSKTLYINGQGSTADAKVEGWAGNLTIEHVVIGKGITQVADKAFEGCIYLKSVQLPSTLTQIGNRAFQSTALSEIVVPKGVTRIGELAFYQCRLLESVKFPDGLKTIGSKAFSKCETLKILEIPGSIEGFGTNVFAECAALEEVHFQNGATGLEASGLFYKCASLRYLELPDSLESLRYIYFTYLDSLETVVIGSKLKTLYEPTFGGCDNLKRFEVSPDNATFCSVDGVIYSKDKTKLIKLPLGFEGAYEVLPGTQKIGEEAADACRKLTVLTIPDSVTFIDDYAFRDCENLEALNLGKGLTELDQGAFAFCRKLKKLVLNEGLVEIGNSAFGWCESLESLTIPSTVTMIKDYAFSGCKGVKRIDFLGDRPTIRLPAFRDVIADAYYPEGNPTWAEEWKGYEGRLSWPQTPGYDFYSGKYEDIDVTWRVDPQTGVLILLGQGELLDASVRWHDMKDMIKSLVIEEGITRIPYGFFINMDQLTDVVIAASVERIDGNVFEDCDALARVEIRGDGVQIGNAVFYNCGALEELRFTGDAPEFHDGALDDCNGPKIYYPRGNETWTDELMAQVYDYIEWEAYGPEIEPDPVLPTPKQLLPWITVGAAVIVAAGAVVIVLLKTRKKR